MTFVNNKTAPLLPLLCLTSFCESPGSEILNINALWDALSCSSYFTLYSAQVITSKYSKTRLLRTAKGHTRVSVLSGCLFWSGSLIRRGWVRSVQFETGFYLVSWIVSSFIFILEICFMLLLCLGMATHDKYTYIHKLYFNSDLQSSSIEIIFPSKIKVKLTENYQS